jgi:hypothetical protein
MTFFDEMISPFHASPTSLAGQRQTMHRSMTKRFVSSLPKPSPGPAAAQSLTPSKYASGMCHALTWMPIDGICFAYLRACRCIMAHSLNLAAQRVLEAFGPTPPPPPPPPPRHVLAKRNSRAPESADVDRDEIEEEDLSENELACRLISNRMMTFLAR